MHPFHPLRGQQFDLIEVRQCWGLERVYYHDEQGRLARMPAEWTTAVEPDPYVVVSAGRSLFRVGDLLRLVELIGATER